MYGNYASEQICPDKEKICKEYLHWL